MLVGRITWQNGPGVCLGLMEEGAPHTMRRLHGHSRLWQPPLEKPNQKGMQGRVVDRWEAEGPQSIAGGVDVQERALR